MSEETAIRVNFGRPMPLFPLAQVTLMPHAVLPVHIFEPRYRQMIDEALDGAGQIAMAVIHPADLIDTSTEPREHHLDAELDAEDEDDDDLLNDADDPHMLGETPDAGNEPPLRSAVCVGQIVEHHKTPDGRYNIALHGVCRARILREMPKAAGQLYRTALLEPIGLDEVDENSLEPARLELKRMLSSTSLRDMTDSKAVIKHLADRDVPTSAILELVTFALLNDRELRYRLLEEGDPGKRAGLIHGELSDIKRLLDLASRQRQETPPKGCWWN